MLGNLYIFQINIKKSCLIHWRSNPTEKSLLVYRLERFHRVQKWQNMDKMSGFEAIWEISQTKDITEQWTKKLKYLVLS
jgi:hypothetical protein